MRTTIRAPAGAQTQLNIMHTPLRTLAKHVAPAMVVVDCGGAGQCGPNTCAYLLGLAELATLDGPELRAAIKDYVSVAANLERRTNCFRPDDTAYTLGELIISCLESWPDRDATRDVTVEAWAEAIAKPESWTDLAFLHCVADAYSVAIDILAVNDLSAVWSLGRLLPCEGAGVEAELAVGMWWNRHLVAIALHPLAASAEPTTTLLPRLGRPRIPSDRLPHGAHPTADVRALAAALAPDETAVDRGGGGDCAPNSLAYGLHLVGLANADDGASLRKTVARHALRLAQEDAAFADGLKVRDYLAASMLSWPRHARRGLEASANSWVTLMSREGTYADEAFLAMTADRYDVAVEYRLVDRQGAELRRDALAPPSGRPAGARVVVALWLDHHYVAIVETTPPTDAQPQVNAAAVGARPTAVDARPPSLSFDNGLTISDSQYEALLAESVELARHREAAVDDSEGPDLDEAIAQSMASFPGDTALLAMAQSRRAADADDFLRGMRASLDAAAERLAAETQAQEADKHNVLRALAESESVSAAVEAAARAGAAREQRDTALAVEASLAQLHLSDLDASELYAHQLDNAGTEVGAGTFDDPAYPQNDMNQDNDTDPAAAAPDFALPPAAELTTVAQLMQLLRSEQAPTMLVACEFSGAVRSALEREGYIAISADLRPCVVGGLHFRGDVRDVVAATHWARIYFFPPCFQQLRADQNCLSHKVADGRAFFGCAFVIWCICCDNADVVVVEQSDTIVHDYLDFSDEVATCPDVQVVEFRTSEYGDKHDKFVRLTLRNASIAPPTHAPRRSLRAPNAHRQYANADERDRSRSSWAPMPNTCKTVAQLTRHKPTAAPLDFQIVIAAFAILWHENGNPVPVSYLAADAQPQTRDARKYQQRRGPGDGRRIVAVTPDGARRRDDMPPSGADSSLECGILAESDQDCDQYLTLGDATGGDDRARKRPTHPPEVRPVGTGTETVEEINEPEELNEPGWSPAEEHVIDVRSATSAAALLIFVSVLVQPLVLAHVDGFTTAGLVMPIAAKRPDAMSAVQRLCSAVTMATSYIAFMIGEYTNGARVFTAPIDFYPRPDAICRTSEQRRTWQRRGVAFAWCTVAALAGTPIGDAAARAVIGCDMFVKPVRLLADAPLSADAAEFNFGVGPARSAINRPLLDSETSPPAWRALALLARADAMLVGALNAATDAGDLLLGGWSERVTPLSVGDVPPHLLENLPDFSDDRLDSSRLSVQAAPLRTAWIPKPPRQPPPPADAPPCPRSAEEMLTDEGRVRLTEWLEAQRADLQSIRDGLARGESPADVRRLRPQPIAIGQSEMLPWARGRVWDCTLEASQCCVVADFHAPILENLNRGVLSDRLFHYADQALVSNLVEGAKLDADVELQLVLIPHLLSIAFGYASVAKELKRLEAAGWYKSFPYIPYFPMYFNGNGAVPRKLEDRWRRCVEGGGPRQETCDASGLRAISINDASHLRYMPAHFVADQRPEFRQWLRQRGLPPEVEERPDEDGAVHASKWPKERKPRLIEVMRDMAVFGRAAFVTGQAVYTAGDDAKDYFSQMPMAASELSKVGVLFLEPGEGEAEPARLRFVSERVLGFGTHGASNIAQRLSDAIMVMYYEDMDEAEAAAGIAEGERAWLEGRLALMRKQGAPCHFIRRFTAAPSAVLPDIAAPLSVAEIPSGYVCPELRLYSGYMYTDDNELLFVGVDRSLRGLRAWKRLVTRINLLMAIDEKRSLGTWCKWLGVLVISGLGLIAVPKAKILRASEAISLTLGGGADFQTYRSLCGLLEHLLAVVLRGRNVMHGLYRPHGPEGASRFGPSAMVECDELMRKQLERWRALLVRACGASVKRALLRNELEPLPEIYFDMTSDACYADVERAGIGGFMHGLYWYFAVPEADRPLLSIPILEFLGVCFNVLTFHAHTVGLGAGVHLLMRTDALTTARTLPAESMRSPLLVAAYQWLTEQAEWDDTAPRALVQHIFGDCNPLSDLVSRAKWSEFDRLCAQLGIHPRAVEVADKCHSLYEHVMLVLRREPTADASLRMHANALEHGPANNGAGQQQPFSHTHVGADEAQQAVAPGSPPQPYSPPRSPPPAAPLTAAETLRAIAAAPARLRDVGRQPAAPPTPPPPEARQVGGNPSAASPPPSAADTLRGLASGARDPAAASTSRPVSSVGARAKRGLTYAGVVMPPAPPKRPRQASALLEAGRHYARLRVMAFTQGGEPGMALRADIVDLMGIGDSIEELVEHGVNSNTWEKDSRAWDMWVSICDGHCCSPYRTAAEARDFPERNAHLLAALMFHAFSTCKPKDAKRSFIKPRSAMAYPLAIIRIFARWSVPMPSYKMLKAALQGIARMYVAYHGPYSMAPRRSEPMKFSMVRALDAIPDGASVASLVWEHDDHDVFMFRRLNRVMIVTAFRLGEIVRHSSGEVMYLTFESLVWSIGGVLVSDPTPQQLMAMRSGIDGARLAPPRSKPDQWGEIHCPFSAVLTYDANDPTNAAAALRDIEIRCRVRGAKRAATPLFHDEGGNPYTHSLLHHMLRAAIAYVYGKAAASLYSWHSYRSGLASALHAAGVDDAMIQLICRWMCPESLHVYRRMGVAEHERHIKKASLVDIDVIQSGNAPRVFADQGYAELVDEMGGKRGATEQRAYEAAIQAALNPYCRDGAGAERPPQAPPKPPRAGRARPDAPAAAAQPQQSPGGAVDESLEVGTPVAILREVWPSNSCDEMAGRAWHATVVARAKGAATIRFTYARTTSGRRYGNERLTLDVLRCVVEA